MPDSLNWDPTCLCKGHRNDDNFVGECASVELKIYFPYTCLVLL